jgi:hypothetical protein
VRDPGAHERLSPPRSLLAPAHRRGA